MIQFGNVFMSPQQYAETMSRAYECHAREMSNLSIREQRPDRFNVGGIRFF
jgi:hypothetical protein